MAGHGCPCRAAVAALDYVYNVVRLHFSAAYLDECADDGSHHVAQKSVSGDDKAVVVIIDALPAGFAEVADVCVGVGVELGEGCEVAAPKHQGGSFVHGVKVEQRRSGP